MQRSSPLNVHAIHSHLTTRSLGRRIELHERLDSTNREAVALGQAGVEHGTLVLADAQTAGRGRMARTWFSPPGMNLYASLVIRPTVDARHLAAWLSWLPLMAALGAAEAIETVGSLSIEVKWPNDLLINERKVGGILCESGTAAGVGPFQVVGLGINVNGVPEDFPEDLRGMATTLRHESGGFIDRNRLIAQVLQELESCLEEFLQRGRERIALAYRRRCTTIGRTVKALLADGTECIGVAQAIDLDGSLTLIEPSMKGNRAAPVVRQLRAADIVHLR
ncbi:MAG TPA: biotin--[acetyl-CoA-carboxylase] ligase [Nitrospira sp.]|nr:biotin--[acetyl-CoA-carboxylase] ligase [Nitrospira sp.]